jgi:hypothetical protein
VPLIVPSFIVCADAGGDCDQLGAFIFADCADKARWAKHEPQQEKRDELVSLLAGMR